RVDAGDLVMAVRGMVDDAEPRAERHLIAWGEVQTAKDEDPVVLQRVEYRGRQIVVVDQPLRLDVEDLGTDRGGQFVEGEQTHRGVLSGDGRVAAAVREPANRCGS